MAWWLFQNVVMTTALAGIVALVCRAGRIGPVARHALWVLVLVKFVTPPLVVWPWAAPDPFGIATLDARPIERDVPSIDVSPAPTLSGNDEARAVWSAPHVDIAIEAAEAAPTEFPATVWPWLLAVWGIGSLCLIALESIRVVRLSRRIRAATPPEEAIVARVNVLAARMGIREVPVVAVAGCTSPAVWGVGRPLLLWPAALPSELTEACIDGLLVHELAHIKRGDHLVGWIELAAGVVWWWNPLFWWVRSALREQAELACDGWVISALPNGRRAYAESLLALSGAVLHGDPSSMAVVGIRATSRRVLERRLVMIMKGRTPLRLPFVGLCSLALVASATLPAWATSQQPPTPPTVVAQTPPAPPAAAAQAAPARPTSARQTPPSLPARAATRTVPQGEERRQVAPVRAVPLSEHLTLTRKISDGTMHWTVTPRVLANMPADGKALLDAFSQEQEAIQKEADQKAVASREALTKSLQALQDRFTKEGKLDEAVAIRDYLRSPGHLASRQSRMPIIRKQ